MDKIYVVFWTQGGNTQAMAEAIGEGIREAGKEAEVVFVTGADIEALKAAPKFALGCPAMGAEVLEEAEMNLAERIMALEEAQITEQTITTLEESDITMPAAREIVREKQLGFIA